MALSLDEVRRIAHLARIEITPAEAADVRAKLERIFELIGVMRAVDTTGIVPMSHAQDVVAAAARGPDHRDRPACVYQQGAPAVEDGLYLVPKVIE